MNLLNHNSKNKFDFQNTVFMYYFFSFLTLQHPVNILLSKVHYVNPSLYVC